MQKAIKAHQKIYLSTHYNGQLLHASALTAAAAPHARRQPSSSVNSSRKMRRQPGFFYFLGGGGTQVAPCKEVLFSFAQ
jgi:hypothetical protein